MKTFIKWIALTALSAVGCRADIVIAFDDPSQAGSPGQMLQFFGTITNTGSDPDPVYLNSDSFNFALSSLSYTLTDQFFSTVPASLAGGASSGDIELFDITLANPVSDPVGSYTGAYGLLGGMDGGNGTAQDNLVQADFSVDVNTANAAAPEPAPCALVGALLALMGWLHLRARGTKRQGPQGR